MTDPAIIAASYAAERNYSHNPDDVIDPSGAVLAIGTEKVDITTLKDRSPEDNNATIHGAMPTEGFIQGRRYDGVDDKSISQDSQTLRFPDIISGIVILSTSTLNGDILSKYVSNTGFVLVTQSNLTTIKIGTGTDYEATNPITINDGTVRIIGFTLDGVNATLYTNGVPNTPFVYTALAESTAELIIGGHRWEASFSGKIMFTILFVEGLTQKQHIDFFNTLARLPFWSVNYTDYPDNATEYTDNLPYSSSIISSGTFKVDDDKLQCVSAGTITYSASYEFDGSEFIKVMIDGVEYAGTGTITHGNTTVSVAQGSNKVTIQTGTSDTIDKINIQFREEVN